MRLTTFSDYSLRVLMYAHAGSGRLVTIEETARTYDISRGHLMKVVNVLTRAGFLRASRGRSGGYTLAKAAEDINLGDVVRVTEPDFALVECFGPDNRCIIADHCGLPNMLNEALQAFVSVFDKYTLADIVVPYCAFSVSDGRLQKQRGPALDHKSPDRTDATGDQAPQPENAPDEISGQA